MRKSMIIILAVAVPLGAWLSCYMLPPRSPIRTNTKLAFPETRLVTAEDRDHDAEVLVRITNVSEFRKRTQGNWITTWYVCRARVIRTLAGALADPQTRHQARGRALSVPEGNDLCVPTEDSIHALPDHL